jgi:hypothetical protein
MLRQLAEPVSAMYDPDARTVDLVLKQLAASTPAPIPAVGRPITPPRGRVVDFAVTDRGVLFIYNATIMDRRQALDLTAVVLGLALVDVEGEAGR